MIFTIISVCCFPKNVKGVVKVSGREELSSLLGPRKSLVAFPNWNNCNSLDDTVYRNEKMYGMKSRHGAEIATAVQHHDMLN